MTDKDWKADIALLKERDRKSRMILGVSETADQSEIRQTFRRAGLEHHPDRNKQDSDASRQFHLICSAYKFLTEGEASDALDQFNSPPEPPVDGKYSRDNMWGYWCWWRENYFSEKS